MSKIVVKFSLFLLTIVLACIQVFILNTYSTSGEILTQFQRDVNTLDAENITLSQKIASSSAIANVSVKAVELGFVKSSTPLSLSSPLPVALRQDIQL